MQRLTIAEQIDELERLRERLLTLCESRKACPRCGLEDRNIFGLECTCRRCRVMWSMV